MDFIISRSDLTTALRQILQGQKASTTEVVDFTAAKDSMTFVITGRSIVTPVETSAIGAARVPVATLLKLKKIIPTYKEDAFRIRISEGKFRLNGYTVSDPGISLRPIGKRIIDIPADALDLDLLALPFLFTREEIEESALAAKVLDAQHSLFENLNSLTSTLNRYNINSREIRDLVVTKIKAHATGLGNILFDHGNEE